MSIKEKTVAFLAALLLTLLAFNVIASQVVDILRIGKTAGFEVIVSSSAPPGRPVGPFSSFLSQKRPGVRMELALILMAIALIVLAGHEFIGKGPRSSSGLNKGRRATPRGQAVGTARP